MLKPLYMYAGDKTRLLKHYAPLLSSGMTSYIEPFFGGGALFANNPDIASSVTINDTNAELMTMLKHIRDNTSLFCTVLKRLELAYFHASNRKDHYYAKRLQYWQAEPDTVSTSALLCFLMKTGFNGIWQTCVASNGRFGTPAGLLNHKDGLFDYDLVYQWGDSLRNVDILTGSYANMNINPSNAFIFCDPPYRDSFTSYGTGFNDDDQLHLIDQCVKWCQAGNIVWLANRTATDGFFDNNLPAWVKVFEFKVTYTAGRRKKAGDGSYSAVKASEFVAVFDPAMM